MLLHRVGLMSAMAARMVLAMSLFVGVSGVAAAVSHVRVSLDPYPYGEVRPFLFDLHAAAAVSCCCCCCTAAASASGISRSGSEANSSASSSKQSCSDFTLVAEVAAAGGTTKGGVVSHLPYTTEAHQRTHTSPIK